MDEKLLHLCEKPFALDEHGFVGESGDYGTPYIKKDAIRRRLSQLDPHWKNVPPEFSGITGDVITYRGGLILLGDTRHAIGAAIFQQERKGKDGKPATPITGYDLAREIAKAHKSAQSDLLPRCALEWNIGAYMRDSRKVKNIKTPAQLETYIKELLVKWESGQHWSLNGKGEAFKSLATALGIRWDMIKTQLEPGRTLTGLTDITVSFDAAVKALAALRVQPSPLESKPTELHPVSG